MIQHKIHVEIYAKTQICSFIVKLFLFHLTFYESIVKIYILEFNVIGGNFMSEGMLKAVITGIFAVIAALITAASTIWSAYIQAQTVNRVDESNGQNVPSVSIEEVTPEQQYDVQEEHPVPTQGNDLNVEDSIDTKSELDEKILNAQHTYQRAITLYENGQYEEALLAFSELGNYSDSSAYRWMCKAGIVGALEANYQWDFQENISELNGLECIPYGDAHIVKLLNCWRSVITGWQWRLHFMWYWIEYE